VESVRVLGARLREYRLLKGLSQAGLGAMIGVSFQQIQKYEKGMNTLSPWKLARLAAALGVTVSDLMENPEAWHPEGQPASQRMLFVVQGLYGLEKERPEAFAAICHLVGALGEPAKQRAKHRSVIEAFPGGRAVNRR
jgi:transcriptional regulator with XRE-family HTH domain